MIWNVIDRRGNQFRWARVHAVIEATWHDNSTSGADQAPRPTRETEVVHDEREGISVAEAIAWAGTQTCPVTLYLDDGGTAPGPSGGEVDAAARILDAFGRRAGWWPPSSPAFDDLDASRKTDFRFMVQGMLRAAARARDRGVG